MPQLTNEQWLALSSVVSSLLMAFVALGGIFLQYLKNAHEERLGESKEHREIVLEDYARRDAQYKEVADENERLRAENRQLQEDKRTLQDQVTEYKLKELIRTTK